MKKTLLPLFFLGSWAFAAPSDNFKSVFSPPGESLPEFWKTKVANARAMRASWTPADRSQSDSLQQGYIKAYIPDPDVKGACNREIAATLKGYRNKVKAYDEKLKRLSDSFTAADLEAQLTLMRKTRELIRSEISNASSPLGEKIRNYNKLVKSFPPGAFSVGFAGPMIVKDGKTAEQVCAPLIAEIQSLLLTAVKKKADQTVTLGWSDFSHAIDQVSVCTRRDSHDLCSVANLNSSEEAGVDRSSIVKDSLSQGDDYLPTLENEMSSNTLQACMVYDTIYGDPAVPPAAVSAKGNVTSPKGNHDEGAKKAKVPAASDAKPE